MERCPGSGFDLRIVPLDAGWNDLGAWDAVWQVGEEGRRRQRGRRRRARCTTRATRLVHATSRLVGVVGLDDVIVVETADAVLVAHRDRSQDVKKIVAALGDGKRTEQTLHRKVHRPWGWYDSIDSRRALPGQADHGQAGREPEPADASPPRRALDRRLGHRRGDQRRQGHAAEREPEHLHPARRRSIASPTRGKVPLEIIEVQSGSYLGEDDIVRFEDTYGRN